MITFKFENRPGQVREPVSTEFVVGAFVTSVVSFAVLLAVVFLCADDDRVFAAPLFHVLQHVVVWSLLRFRIIAFDSKSALGSFAIFRIIFAAVTFVLVWTDPAADEWHHHVMLGTVPALFLFSIWSTFVIGRLSGLPARTPTEEGGRSPWVFDRAILFEPTVAEAVPMAGRKFNEFVPALGLPGRLLEQRIGQLFVPNELHSDPDSEGGISFPIALNRMSRGKVVLDAVRFRNATTGRYVVRVDLMMFIWVGTLRMPIYLATSDVFPGWSETADGGKSAAMPA